MIEFTSTSNAEHEYVYPIFVEYGTGLYAPPRARPCPSPGCPLDLELDGRTWRCAMHGPMEIAE